MDACVKRQMSLRDPVSGVAIQRGDAERFCNRKSQRCWIAGSAVRCNRSWEPCYRAIRQAAGCAAARASL